MIFPPRPFPARRRVKYEPSWLLVLILILTIVVAWSLSK